MDGTELLDLAGRIMLTHQIAPAHLQKVIGGDLATAKAVIERGPTGHPPDKAATERLALFVNVLLRLEGRLLGNGPAIRRALDVPLPVLGNRAPAALFDGSVDDLRAVRMAIDTIEVPQERWFRVGHNR